MPLYAPNFGAAQIIAVDADPHRLSIARKFGATSVILAEADTVGEIKELTENHGVDVAIEAIGLQNILSPKHYEC